MNVPQQPLLSPRSTHCTQTLNKQIERWRVNINKQMSLCLQKRILKKNQQAQNVAESCFQLIN